MVAHTFSRLAKIDLARQIFLRFFLSLCLVRPSPPLARSRVSPVHSFLLTQPRIMSSASTASNDRNDFEEKQLMDFCLAAIRASGASKVDQDKLETFLVQLLRTMESEGTWHCFPFLLFVFSSLSSHVSTLFSLSQDSEIVAYDAMKSD